ncbi:MAG TPA: CHAT domain-containing protein, partial [Longimicrobium sp.]|nr:CHAT domain-containing protein [Longimicrobium sp.]
DRLAAPAVLPSLPMDASPAAADSFAAAWPQTARELGWERVLDEWGAAVLAGDAGRAGARLALAERLGAGLARRGGDGTLAQAVAAIRGAPDADAVRRLAQAHRAYAAGQRAYVALNHAVAERELTQAEALGQASPMLVQWAAVFRGATLFYLKKAAASDSLLSLLVAQADTGPAPALAARARWNHGTVLLRLGKYQRAQEEYRVASRLLHRLRETENVGATDYCLGEAEFALGNEAASDSILMHGLSRLRSFPASTWLHTTVFVVGNLSTIRHLQRAEGYLRAEDVAVAERNGGVMYRLEAHTGRVQFLARVSRGGSVDSIVQPLSRLVPLIADTGARAWALNDVRMAGAAAALHGSGPPPLAVLDSAVGFYASQKNPLLLIPALQTRAEARLAARDADGAVADLDSASTLLARLNTQITQTAARVAMLDRAGRLFDQLAMLRLAEKRENLAFAALERGRTTFAGRGRAAAASARGVRATSPSGEVVLSYALVGDTLLAWTLAGTTLQLERTTPGRARLLGTLERVRAALEDGGDEAAVRADLSELYEVLVRRVEGRLGERVVVVADGEIAPAPFAALFDARNGHYLVEDHQLRFAASLRDAVATGAAGAATAPAVLVADPAFSRRAFPLLGRLPAARAEVDSIARGFRGPTVLRDRGATSAALVEALPGAGLLHFAGHAVFDDDRPEQSYLLLAPSDGDDGRLTAGKVGALRLPRMRLVVLAACSTLPGRSGRSGGFAGLSAALLGAGAQGVVGSLWDTDDRLTLPLMVAFHRAYARDRDGAAALREAQLSLLHSGDRELASPSAWAGFRYAGR